MLRQSCKETQCQRTIQHDGSTERRVNSPMPSHARIAPDPVKHHTHVQQVAAGQLVNRLR